MNSSLPFVNRNAFRITEIKGIKLLTLDVLLNFGFIHGFTTRFGGVSKGEFESLNLSISREKNWVNKIENYKRVCSALTVNYESLSLVNYEHGAGVYILKDEDMGKGLSRKTDIEYCDALITTSKHITAVTLHADCTPIFMADKKSGSAAVGHAGWKGTLQNIAFKMAETFKTQLNSKPEDLLVGIGPHIMDCCFEIKDDVAEKFYIAGLGDVTTKNENGIFADLQSALINQLLNANVLPQNIFCADMCTYCESDLFFSHRRDHGHTGAMGAFITAR